MTTFEYYVVGLLLAILCVVFVALQEIIKRLGLNKEILKTLEDIRAELRG